MVIQMIVGAGFKGHWFFYKAALWTRFPTKGTLLVLSHPWTVRSRSVCRFLVLLFRSFRDRRFHTSHSDEGGLSGIVFESRWERVVLDVAKVPKNSSDAEGIK
ncbi:uncharacterized protein LOC9647234 [Selaginella moellendorffii]|uniref:uncharacterized protein LOC9647234 n=1 Tax=Selaginella moellendorffii TaxID=88036 RepID=UPI000D1CFF44|nr:uncharacterized protein LOC9647234 [Selaginella moellendorffii]|eukprot:XP_024542223.1 uncharacterized protein LOC9647234 [Selaginella moellendorffii]